MWLQGLLAKQLQKEHAQAQADLSVSPAPPAAAAAGGKGIPGQGGRIGTSPAQGRQAQGVCTTIDYTATMQENHHALYFKQYLEVPAPISCQVLLPYVFRKVMVLQEPLVLRSAVAGLPRASTNTRPALEVNTQHTHPHNHNNRPGSAPPSPSR